MEKFHHLVKTKYVLKYIIKNKRHECCELLIELFVALSVCIFSLKFFCIFAESFLCIQIKLESFSPEIVSTLENKELLSRFRVYRKSVTSAQKEGQITMDGPLKTGSLTYVQLMFH